MILYTTYCRSSAGKYAVRDEFKNRQKIDTTVEIHDVENREEHVSILKILTLNPIALGCI